jgi:hypothetical protein
MSDSTHYDHESTMKDLEGIARSMAMAMMLVTRDRLTRAAEAVEMASSIGFMVDPTQYRARLWDGGLERQKALIELVRKTRESLAAIFPNDPILNAILDRQEGADV